MALSNAMLADTTWKFLGHHCLTVFDFLDLDLTLFITHLSTTTTPTIPKHVSKVSEKARAVLKDKQVPKRHLNTSLKSNSTESNSTNAHQTYPDNLKSKWTKATHGCLTTNEINTSDNPTMDMENTASDSESIIEVMGPRTPEEKLG